MAIGFDGIIKAEVYGMPRKQIDWKHDGKIVASLDGHGEMIWNEKKRYKIDNRGSLNIKNVTENDEGKYSIIIHRDSVRLEEHATIGVGGLYLLFHKLYCVVFN